MVEHLTDSNFAEKVLKSEKPVLVDFFAIWCGPCKMLAPIIEQLNEEIGEKVNVYKVDVDECPQSASQYGIMSIPTIIAFKNGEAVNKSVGLVQKEKLMDIINSIA